MITVITKSANRKHSRGLIMGSPNTGKTNLLNSIEEEKVLVFNYPDEKGTKSIPDRDNITALLFNTETLPDTLSDEEYYQLSQKKYQIVLETTRKALRGEYGQFDILFADGLSKFFETINDVVCKGKYLRGIPFDDNGSYTTRLYSSSYVLLRNYLSEIYTSEAFPLTIFTSWESLREPNENASDREVKSNQKQGSREWFPAFPRQLAYTITGEFDWTIRAGFTSYIDCSYCQALAKRDRKDEIFTKPHHTYQIQPYEECTCVGVKGRKSSMPFIHQQWELLKHLIS